MSDRTAMLYPAGKSFLIALLFGCTVNAQELYPLKLNSEDWHAEKRSLRYHPEGEDFVITNGKKRFNRALYGTHTAFRVEAGDLPEFSMYMPGLGGTLKLGLLKGRSSIWLSEAANITARYTPGKMGYEIQDPLLGNGKLHIAVLAMAGAEGMVLKVWFEGAAADLSLVYAFGGASGKKFSRAGDMGPDPESSFYLTAENCLNNQYTISGETFELKYGAGGNARLKGRFPSALKPGDGEKLNSPLELYQSRSDSKYPVLTGSKILEKGTPLYFAIANPVTQKPDPVSTVQGDGKFLNADSYHTGLSTATLFGQAEKSRQEIAGRIRVNTPDPYINTLGATISIASDALWEEPSYLHGAVGWRMRLNGWRGPYTADPLGWHDRAKTHYESYGKSQVLEPLTGPVIADTAFHLARHQEKMGTSMFSAGYISRDPEGKSIRPHHYDMNLIYTDGLLWHLNWTGDRDFAKKMWPVLQRHLAWEKRNFDPDNDGLYDAYAAIWASDALYYSGGGVTHSSAYNYRANQKAAAIALLIGENPKIYQEEAAKILKAMNAQLWMPENGVYAEFKDGLGLKMRHPSAAPWTVYHSIDSEVPDAFQAWQSLRYTDQEIPHIPVRAAGLKDGKYYTLSSSSWMPYTWSVNNVVMAESMHTALANWQSGRNEEGFKLFKSELLAAMYLGGSPGNFVQISHYDAIRGEAYRDFGDPVGISSRALVEGLFGIVPDALQGKLMIRPGFPASWDHAAITTPDISFDFKRNGNTDQYKIGLSFPVPLRLTLQLKARGNNISRILVNGREAVWKNITTAVGLPMVEISTAGGGKIAPAEAKAKTESYDIRVIWEGTAFDPPQLRDTYAGGDQLQLNFGQAVLAGFYDPQQVFVKHQYQGAGFSGTIAAGTGNKTAFVQLKMGSYTWWYPLCFELKARVSLVAEVKQVKDKLTVQLLNNSNKRVQGVLSLKGFSKQLTLLPAECSETISLAGEMISPGSNLFSFKEDDGSLTWLKLMNWNIQRKAGKQRTIDLNPYFNDRVTEIFKHKYLSPRPAGPTLQLPWQGIGDWPHALEMVNIDDSGLRKLGTVTFPQGIQFQTPSEPRKPNILFTSQWDNFPSEKEITLSGHADHAYFLMAGSTNHMQSQLDNGKIIISYTDGSNAELVLRNPESWWPVQEDYYTDGFAFQLKQPRPPRLHLKTGVIITDTGESQPTENNRSANPEQQAIDGGAATVLDLVLDPGKTLKSLKLVTLANDVVIGLMGVTLTAPD